MAALRGPDSEGYWTNGANCQLGFRRLSILDLSEAGNQPMKKRIFVSIDCSTIAVTVNVAKEILDGHRRNVVKKTDVKAAYSVSVGAVLREFLRTDIKFHHSIRRIRR